MPERFARRTGDRAGEEHGHAEQRGREPGEDTGCPEQDPPAHGAQVPMDHMPLLSHMGKTRGRRSGFACPARAIRVNSANVTTRPGPPAARDPPGRLRATAQRASAAPALVPGLLQPGLAGKDVALVLWPFTEVGARAGAGGLSRRLVASRRGSPHLTASMRRAGPRR